MCSVFSELILEYVLVIVEMIFHIYIPSLYNSTRMITISELRALKYKYVDSKVRMHHRAVKHSHRVHRVYHREIVYELLGSIYPPTLGVSCTNASMSRMLVTVLGPALSFSYYGRTANFCVLVVE